MRSLRDSFSGARMHAVPRAVVGELPLMCYARPVCVTGPIIKCIPTDLAGICMCPILSQPVLIMVNCECMTCLHIQDKAVHLRETIVG